MASAEQQELDDIGELAKLATTQFQNGQIDIATETQERVVERSLAALGKSHQETLTNMENLATAYKMQERWDQVLRVQLDIVESTKARPEPDTEEIIEAVSSAASTLRRNGREEEAIQLETREIFDAIGTTREKILEASLVLADCQKLRGDWDSAEKTTLQAIGVSTDLHGPDASETLMRQSDLVTVYWNLDRWGEAAELQTGVLKRARAVLGEDHPDISAHIATLTLTYRSMGQLEDVVPLEEELMQRLLAEHGENHPESVASMTQLAKTYRNLGKLPEAELLQKKAVDLLKANLGDDDPDTATGQADLARIYSMLGRFSEAVPLFKQSLSAPREDDSPYSSEDFETMADLAIAMKGANEDCTAQRCMRDAINGLTKTLGPEDESTLAFQQVLEQWSS